MLKGNLKGNSAEYSESQSLEETQFIGRRRRQSSWQVGVREDAVREDRSELSVFTELGVFMEIF